MDARLALLSIHVIAAVLGIGPVFAMALLASSGPEVAKHLVLLARLVQWALLIMLLSGLLLLRETGWFYMHARWLQLAFALFVIVGAMLGMTNRPLRKAIAAPAPEHLVRVRRFAWICVVLVGVIAALMVAKPT